MSSPKELLSQADLKTGQLEIPAQGRFLSYEAICEALSCELEGHVWQITHRQTTPEGILVDYKALPVAQWKILQQRLEPKDWPLLPQEEKHRRDLHRKRQVELVVMALTSALFVILLTIGSMAYQSNASYERGLNAILAGRSGVRVSKDVPQTKWVSSINNATRLLASQGYRVEAFEVSASGGWIEIEAPQNAPMDVLEVLESAWPEVAFVPQKGGYKWSW